MPTTESAVVAEQEILAAKIERLQALDVQVARFGWFAPPYMRNEAKELRRELERARRVAPQSDTERWSLLYGELRDVRDEVRDVRASQRQLYVLLPVLMVFLSMFLAVVVSVNSQHAATRPSATPIPAGHAAPVLATPTIDWRGAPVLGGRR